jgi:hypothetical protein
MRETKLLVIQDGATAAELQRGADAVLALFAAAGVAAWDAARAAWMREGAAGTDTVRESELAALWDKAPYIAADACCAGWAGKPDTVELQLIEIP